MELLEVEGARKRRPTVTLPW